QKRINLDSPLWLRWRLDQRVIASRETPIEVHYESLGTYYEIYVHYLIVRSIKKGILFIYIRSTVGHSYRSNEILPKREVQTEIRRSVLSSQKYRGVGLRA
ncbi:DNA-directed RNA polymerase subunit beta', partial [Phtheirospermum japonicum]